MARLSSTVKNPDAPKTGLIRVAIVEDHSGFRETLIRMFDGTSDFEVVAACANTEEALTTIPKTGCDIVLLDIKLPGASGIDCLRSLKRQMPNVRLVMLTAYDDNDNLFQSLTAGADGYLLKRTPRGRLLDSLRDIVGGGAPISPQIARRMVEYFHMLHGRENAGLVPANSELKDLTAREREVLALLADGQTPKEVADTLEISWQTVRNHIRVIYEKLHVHTRTDAVLKYFGRVPSAERK
jgi:Response regulator containing a CheY-like receiver domain and an HTH DNA-binding domain